MTSRASVATKPSGPAKGVTVTELPKLGMRCVASCSVHLDEVFVPDAAVALVRPAGVWHPVWNTVIGAATPLIMSVYVGIAEAAVDLVVDLLGRRALSLIHISEPTRPY